MAWTGLKENSCCCCWMWFLIGHFVFQTTVRLAARVCLCYLGSSCFGRCVFIILTWRWRACQSEAPPAPFVALLCVFAGTALEARVLHIWADTSQRLKTSKQTHPRVTFPATVCGTLNKTWQTSDAARELSKTNVCFGAKQDPGNHFAPHARLSCEALFSRWDGTCGEYQAFKAQCWQLKKLPSTTAAGRTAVRRMKRAFDFGFV